MAIRTGQGLGYLHRTTAFTKTADWCWMTQVRLGRLPANLSELFVVRGVGDRSMATPYVLTAVDAQGFYLEHYNGVTRTRVTGPTLLEAGVWYRLFLSYTGSVLTVYIGKADDDVSFWFDSMLNLSGVTFSVNEEWLGGNDQHGSVIDVDTDVVWQAAYGAIGFAAPVVGPFSYTATPLANTPLSGLADLRDRQGGFHWSLAGTLAEAQASLSPFALTAVDLLDSMSVLDNELELGEGQSDEAIALKALSMAQKYFESLCAVYPNVLASLVTVSPEANLGQSAWPSSLLRLDAVQALNADNQPVWNLEDLGGLGGAVSMLPWPLTLSAWGVAGAPGGFTASLGSIGWLPTPGTASTIRLVGLVQQPKFRRRTDPFGYPSQCEVALANFACRLLSIGVADETADLDRLASQIYTPLLKSLRKFVRTGPQGRVYTDVHTT